MTIQITQPGVTAHDNQHDTLYSAFLASVEAEFLASFKDVKVTLFTTDAKDLFTAYLGTFEPATARQYHSCHSCRQFVGRFGGLVTIDANGLTKPVLWREEGVPEFYRPSVAALALRVRNAKVSGVFLASDALWGRPATGAWRHLAVKPPAALVFCRATQSAGQAMAEKREDFGAVMRALDEFTLPVVAQALTVLRTDALYRHEKVLGQAEWMHALHLARSAAHGSRAKENAVWHAVATAPSGFCHPRSSMIGTLLADIAGGRAFDEVARRFADKMHPLQYQRPQAPPKAGAIDAAEKIIRQLGAAGSLERRFARLDEVQALWKPAPPKSSPAEGGVFGHLRQKVTGALSAMKIPPQNMTWEKFQRSVLPTATRIEFCAPERGNYSSLVTAVHADAPPILQWDSLERRNPVSGYVWHGGSTAAQFGLKAGAFHPVTAIALQPWMWGGEHQHAHQGHGVIFILDSARDSRTPTACLFPEILKAEFHSVRSVLEAYSKKSTMKGASEASAAGMSLAKGQSWEALVRVWCNGQSMDYQLDRWD